MNTTIIDSVGVPGPRLLRCDYGGWLAVSGPGEAIRIGVYGLTAEEARMCFTAEMARWRRLLQPDHQEDR